MTRSQSSWAVFLAVCLTVGFSVFVLPFFFPPAFSLVISVSNDAGFNNKIAAVAAAGCAAAVFFLFSRLPQLIPAKAYGPVDLRPLPWRVVGAAALFVFELAGGTALLLSTTDRRLLADVDYFINQMSSHVDYHRELYVGIEFPYGPLLFYPPILLHSLSRGHLSLTQSFFAVQLLHQILGIFLLAYLVNSFPMSRGWKYVGLWCYAVFTLQPMGGPNYTLLRFTLALAVLVFSIRQRSVWRTAFLFFLGQMLTLGLSPEMGFAFAAAAVFFSLFQAVYVGWRWVLVALVIPVGAGLFLLIVGAPYLQMLKLFAGGAYNFIVEPMPYMLLFLFGLVWLVPRMLVDRLRDREQDVALLGASFVFSLALLPVALGRADPVHVFFNGLGIFLLSMTALSLAPRWQQQSWSYLFVVTLLLGLLLAHRLVAPEVHRLARREIYAHRSSYPIKSILRVASKMDWVGRDLYKVDATDTGHLDIARLQRITLGESVATPLAISRESENLLKQHDLYRPDFYYFMVAVLDARGERRKIRDFDQAHWALLPTGADFHLSESQATEKKVIGSMLTYPSRKPYVEGALFEANLLARWEAVTQIGAYTLYQNKQVD